MLNLWLSSWGLVHLADLMVRALLILHRRRDDTIRSVITGVAAVTDLSVLSFASKCREILTREHPFARE